MTKVFSKTRSSLIIAGIYLFTFFCVYTLFPNLSFPNSIATVFVADVIATIIVFVFSFIFNNSSVYDPYWSVVPPILGIYIMSLHPDGNSLRQFIVMALVLLWSIRLTSNWFRGWKGLKQQDWRYTSFAEKTKKWYWMVSFLGIHFMPTVFVFLGCLPLWYALSSGTPFTFLDALAALITFTAILTEWIADEQLLKFRNNNSGQRIMKEGLWAFSRHPNYLGEICFWIGIYLFALSSAGLKQFSGLWTAVGFISMILLFKFISIPIMEKRNIAKRPEYLQYMKNVQALVPRFLKRTF